MRLIKYHTLSKAINGSDTSKTDKILLSLSGVGTKESLEILQTVALSNKYQLPVRKYAAAQIGRSGDGEKKVEMKVDTRKFRPSISARPIFEPC